MGTFLQPVWSGQNFAIDACHPRGGGVSDREISRRCNAAVFRHPPQLNLAGGHNALRNRDGNRRSIVDDEDLRGRLILAQARIKRRLQRGARLPEDGNGNIDAAIERYRWRSFIHRASSTRSHKRPRARRPFAGSRSIPLRVPERGAPVPGTAPDSESGAPCRTPMRPHLRWGK